MTNTYERCSCGARDRTKCSRESLKRCDAQPINLKGLSEATEDRMSKVDRDIRQLRKELEDDLEKYEAKNQ